MIPFSQLFRVFGRIGLLSFGGPAAQIALMHRELVDDHKWLTEAQFLRALSFCMLLPGPEAMQLATYAGWKQRGLLGGLLAGGLFVIPGAIVILALALAYGTYGNLPLVQALFLGVKATVVVIVIEAILRVAKRALKRRSDWAIAGLAFVALYVFAVPFPVVILAAGIFGALRQTGVAPAPISTALPWANSGLIVLVGLVLWALPLLLAYATGAAFLLDLGLFFSKLAVVTFGGAYAVLSYMTQAVVQDFGWLTTAQMMDALGLAETTPGPLILVTQFVGVVAGLAHGGLATGLLGGAMVLWVTFVPCFIWIFAGAPLIDWLAGKPRLSGALAAITAAVVGVIANLTLWFALHVLFARQITATLGPAHLLLPIPQSLDPIALGLAVLAGWLMLWRHWSLLTVMGLCAVLSLGLTAATTGI
jgi:chromate transporter